MTYRTYFDKFNTIVSDSDVNVGVSPVAFLYYGCGYSRLLLHFSLSKLIKLLGDKTIPNISKTRHKLKIFNVGNMEHDGIYNTEKINNVNDSNELLRAGNCEVVLFRLPDAFYSGNGYDFVAPTLGDSALSHEGCNWYGGGLGKKWSTEEGVYSTDTISREYTKYLNGEESIIIGTQTFNVGNETLEVDVTDYVNGLLMDSGDTSGDTNNGIGIAFISDLEEKEIEDYSKYLAFFTHKTNTFFEPYLETTVNNTIIDDRNDFYKNKSNKLYLYCNMGTKLDNLDEMPVCTIDGIGEVPVQQATKGIYYVEVGNELSSGLTVGKMYYDTWSNIKYQGVSMDDVEMDFVVKAGSKYFSMGNIITEKSHYVPELYGVKDSEIIVPGDVRKLNFVARKPYTRNQFALVDNMEIRLYVKDGSQEFDVIGYDRMNRSFAENFYMLDTSELIPNTYYIDVKVTTDQEVLIHRDLVHFTIQNNISKQYI